VLPSGIFALPPDRPGNRCCYYSARAGTAVYAPLQFKTPGIQGCLRGIAGSRIL